MSYKIVFVWIEYVSGGLLLDYVWKVGCLVYLINYIIIKMEIYYGDLMRNFC